MLGCEIHLVVGADPLQLGAVRLQTGEWAEAADEELRKHPPVVGERVFVFRYDKIYWFDVVTHGIPSDNGW